MHSILRPTLGREPTIQSKQSEPLYKFRRASVDATFNMIEATVTVWTRLVFSSTSTGRGVGPALWSTLDSALGSTAAARRGVGFGKLVWGVWGRHRAPGRRARGRPRRTDGSVDPPAGSRCNHTISFVGPLEVLTICENLKIWRFSHFISSDVDIGRTENMWMRMTYTVRKPGVLTLSRCQALKHRHHTTTNPVVDGNNYSETIRLSQCVALFSP